MTSSAPVQGDAGGVTDLAGLGDLGDLGLSVGADPSAQRQRSAHGADGAPTFDNAAATADSDAAAVATLTSHATNFPAFDDDPTTDYHTVAALNTTTTTGDVSATGIPSEPLQQHTPGPPASIPLPNPGGDTYLPDVDVDALPPADDLDSLMVDAPDQPADPIPAEPVTPIQSQSQSRHLSRRSSAADRNAIPFASASEASRIRNVISNNFSMMNFAQMSSPHHPMGMSHVPQTPTVVTPAQVTLPNNLADASSGLEGDTYPFPSVEEGLESFARIEFADSVFQLTTYAVIIGRDQRAMDQAKRDERRAGEYRRVAEERANMGLPPPSPEMHDRNRKFSKSYVSEEGGMLGPESDGESATRPQKKRKRTRSMGSSQNEPQQPEDQLLMDRQYVSHTPGAAAVDLQSLRPSPHHTPFIGIHSPGPDIASKTKAISREHLKIEFSVKKNAFEAIPLHKNGFFCDDVHYRQESVVLRSGARLQIKDVDFTFVINGVGRGHTGAEDLEDGPAKLARRYAEGGKEMSVDFELGKNREEMMSDSDELSELEESPAELSDDAEGELKSDSEAEVEEGKSVKLNSSLPEQPPKRRGPGRPPKDGIMSKRERRELAKLEQEMERQKQLEAQATAGSAALAEHLPLGEFGDVPLKRKVGRPRKHPLPEGADGKPEKRKYKPRKPKEEEGSEAERRRERKERRLARPKSPPLRLRREDFTEEQLAKPNKNYGILIDEVLREAGEEGLILKQIYNRIAAKYPFYHFCTETKGWESSVRHNLIGNSAFSKDPKSGAWTRVPGIELDAGKKRKGDSAAAERAAAAAATAAAAAMGGSHFGGSFGGTPYPGYGAGQQVPPGTPQGYSQGGVQGYQQGQQAGYGVQPGQAYGEQPGQLEPSPQHSTPSGTTPRPTHMAPPAQQTNGPSPPVANGATAGQPRHPSGTPQPNGPASAIGGQHGFYGTLQAASQPQTNGAASRQTLAPRPAVPHPQLLASLALFAREMYKYPELDRRWIFSALNRVLGLKPGLEAPQGGRDLADGLERKLVKGMENVARRYFEARAGKETGGKEVLHPELVALFAEFRGNFQRGGAGKEREMGEYMMLSCFDRVVGAREGSVFEGLKEEGVLEEAEAARWGAAEGELMGVVKGYVTGMGFTL